MHLSRCRPSGRRNLPAFLLPAAILAAALAAPPAHGDDTDAVAELRHELAELRSAYEARISELERRLAELEAGQKAPPAAADELERIKAAAAQAAAQTPPPAAPEASGGRLSLNRLNPEVSFTGIFLGVATDGGREELTVQEFELDLQAALDPFSRTRFTLAVGEEGKLEIEEGYVTYASLPGGLTLTAGKFRQSFGALNRQHLHALPQTEYPAVLTTFFDQEGLGQTGLSFEWLLPRGWATANEVTLQLTDGESEAFGGEAFESLAVLAKVKSYWEIGEASWFEWGLSGIVGESDGPEENRVWGTDLTYHWQPPARAKYRELTWRSELLLSQRDDGSGEHVEAWGGYSYLEGLVRRNLYLGVRVDRVEDPLEPALRSWGVVPYVTWWQSEFVRLRAQFEHLEQDGGEDESRFVLQLTWAAGPHKHETY